MLESSSKKIMLAALAASFVLQTGLVYTDDVDIQLSDDAIEGRKLFHEGSCQVCHQLWGQGGFLGPDLTNVASRIEETRLVSLLTVGSGQMPSFAFDEQQIGQIRSFLEEIDDPSVGRGQLRLGDASAGTTPQAAFDASVVEADPPPDVLAGYQTFRSGICSSCHFPFQVSLVGAPDLSTVVDRVDDEGIHAVLTDGRPSLGMPPPVPALSEQQRSEMTRYFHWLNDNRTQLLADSERRQSQRTVEWSRLAWWEFR